MRKSQNSYNGNQSKNSYLKLTINTSLNKTKNIELNRSKNNDKSIRQKKINIINLENKKYIRNSSYSKVQKDIINIKIANYLKKFNSYSRYSTNINSPKKISVNIKTENKNNKKLILNESNKLKIIPINKKSINIKGKLMSSNSKGKKIINSSIKKKNNLNLNKIKINQNKKKLFSDKYSPKNENPLIKKVILKNKIDSIKSKLNKAKIKESKNKVNEDKIIVNKNKKLYKNLIPISLNRNSNFLKIRKQNSKEDDDLAQKNTGIIEIKVDKEPHSSRCAKNKYLHSTSCENKFKEYHSTNSNHNFVNINLCKDKINNDIIPLEDKFLTKQNSFPDFKYKLSIKNEENEVKNLFDNNSKKENNISSNNNHIFYRSYHSSGGKRDYNIINENKKIEENKKEDININNNQIKIFENGRYEGIIINEKREIK